MPRAPAPVGTHSLVWAPVAPGPSAGTRCVTLCMGQRTALANTAQPSHVRRGMRVQASWDPFRALGKFATEEAAALAHDRAMFALLGDRVAFNFPGIDHAAAGVPQLAGLPPAEARTAFKKWAAEARPRAQCPGRAL